MLVFIIAKAVMVTFFASAGEANDCIATLLDTMLPWNVGSSAGPDALRKPAGSFNGVMIALAQSRFFRLFSAGWG